MAQHTKAMDTAHSLAHRRQLLKLPNAQLDVTIRTIQWKDFSLTLSIPHSLKLQQKLDETKQQQPRRERE